MALLFVIPGQLRPFTNGREEVRLDGRATSVGEALALLWSTYPGVRDRVITELGDVRPHVNVFVDGQNIRYAGGLAAGVQEESEIVILPAVSGGEHEREHLPLSRDARIVCGVTLLTVPTIMYGGVTLLGILTRGAAGIAPEGVSLSETQWALFRAGHAHAGVWLILSLVLQVLLDSAVLTHGWKWLARLTAPFAAAAISGGFFGVAFIPGFRWLIYLGAVSMAVSVLVTGIGLLRRTRATSG
jgi:molybdopterin converting factor small subunit